MWLDKISATEDGLLRYEDRVLSDPIASELLLLWRDIGQIIKNYLNLPISPHELLAAAALIGNPYEGTGNVWTNIRQKYGTNEPSQALLRLAEAREMLQKLRSSCKTRRCN